MTFTTRRRPDEQRHPADQVTRDGGDTLRALWHDYAGTRAPRAERPPRPRPVMRG